MDFGANDYTLPFSILTWSWPSIPDGCMSNGPRTTVFFMSFVSSGNAASHCSVVSCKEVYCCRSDCDFGPEPERPAEDDGLCWLQIPYSYQTNSNK